MRLHHVGVVVASVETARTYYAGLGLVPEGAVVEDPTQRVRIQFLTDVGGVFRIELLEPMGEDSPVRRSLEEGGGLNHLCYAVKDLDRTLTRLRSEGAVLVSGPVAAPAIGGARVAFLFDRSQGLFELVEAPPTPSEVGTA